MLGEKTSGRSVVVAVAVAAGAAEGVAVVVVVVVAAVVVVIIVARSNSSSSTVRVIVNLNTTFLPGKGFHRREACTAPCPAVREGIGLGFRFSLCRRKILMQMFHVRALRSKLTAVHVSSHFSLTPKH